MERLRRIILDQCHSSGRAHHTNIASILENDIGKEVTISGHCATSLFKPIIDKILEGASIHSDLREIHQGKRPDLQSFLRFVRSRNDGITVSNEGILASSRYKKDNGEDLYDRVCREGLRGMYTHDVWKGGWGDKLQSELDNGRIWMTPDQILVFNSSLVTFRDSENLRLLDVRLGRV